MPAVSFSQLEFIVNKARTTPSPENKDAAVTALLQFAVAENPKQRIKASTLLPEFHEICTQRQAEIHEAIFDLCEDPSEHVRIAGYHAIVDLSRRASTVRRKNADVLCQLLQSEGASELAVVRGCLSQHVRIASEITYNIIAEYLVTNNGNRPARGPLMGVILSFLDGGGLGPSWTDSTHAISSNEAMAAFSERDVEGGKGALLEVSWLQKNAAADAILRKSLLSALLCATLAEARTIISSILYSLCSECTPLGNDATELLGIMIRMASMQFKKELSKTPTILTKTLSCLDLGASTLSPIVSPIPSFQPDPVLPRANPTPLLKLCHEWIQPALWSKYSIDAQMHITTILGVALRAYKPIRSSGRRMANGHGANLALGIITARNEIIDSMDQVVQSWINSSAYDGNAGICQAISELLFSISERKADSKWTLGSEQWPRIQTMRNIALKYVDGNGSSPFVGLLQCIDAALVPSASLQKDPSPAASSTAPSTLAVIPGPVVVPRPTPNSSSDVSSRKRLRRELEGPDRLSQSNQLSEDRNSKRQKVLPPDTLSIIQKHRASVVSPSNLSTIALKIEAPSDDRMEDIASARQGAPSASPLVSPATSSNPVNVVMSAPALLIRGAASSRVAEKDARAPTHQGCHVEMPSSGDPPRVPALNREHSIATGMKGLKIRPNPSSKQVPLKPNGDLHSPVIWNSSPETQDSVHRLLLGKSGERPVTQERNAPPPPPPRGIPGNSLLNRIAGSNGSLSLPQPQPPAATIFDRMGILPKIKRGPGGVRSDGHKKRGM